MSLYADRTLAAGLEASVAHDVSRYAEKSAELHPDEPSETLAIAGGRAVFLGPESPVNMAYGLGFAGPVTASEIERLERFYAQRGTRAAISLCPLADPSLPAVLARRGWVVSGFENVLVLPLHGAEIPDPPRGVRTKRVDSAADRDLWASISAQAFTAPAPPTPVHERLGEIASQRRDCVLLLGEVDHTMVGTGALMVDREFGWLMADATLPDYRKRGIQSALQIERLLLAREAGCTYAVSESIPGSPSQRNMERLGFRLVYTRVELVAPALQE